MNTKRKGSRAEHRAIALLEAGGYSCTRAAASLGVFDVVAIGRHDIRLVQVKAGKRCAVTAADKRTIAEFRTPANASREIWRFYDYVTRPSIERVMPAAVRAPQREQDLTMALERLQTLVGRAAGVAGNDRDPNRQAKLQSVLREAFDVALNARCGLALPPERDHEHAV